MTQGPKSESLTSSQWKGLAEVKLTKLGMEVRTVSSSDPELESDVNEDTGETDLG